MVVIQPEAGQLSEDSLCSCVSTSPPRRNQSKVKTMEKIPNNMVLTTIELGQNHRLCKFAKLSDFLTKTGDLPICRLFFKICVCK